MEMKKNIRRKNILKGAGVLLITALLVLTSLVFVPTTTAEERGDVGIKEIISPPTSGPQKIYPVEIVIANYGETTEFNIPAEVLIEKNDVVDYDAIVTVAVIAPGESLTVDFPDWYPSEIGAYKVTASILLSRDDNSSNDILTKMVYITIDFMGLGVAPLGLADLAINAGILSVYNCYSGQPETDGAWINLEDSYNHWNMVMENPYINESEKNTSLQITTYVEPIEIFAQGEPVPGAEIFIEQEPCCTPKGRCCEHPKKCIAWPQESASLKVTIKAFIDQNLVFYLDDIPAGEEYLTIGYLYDYEQCEYVGFNVKNQLSVEFTYSSPVNWTWEEQGVNNLSVDRIEVIPENLNQTFTSYYSYNSIYIKNISAINIPEMYASFNNPPSTPTINGQTNGKINVEYTYTSNTTDPQDDQVYYWFDWGDDTNSGWLGPYASGATASAIHKWTVKETYQIKVKTKDIQGDESDWATLDINIPRNKMINAPILLKLLERFSFAFPILRYLLRL